MNFFLLPKNMTFVSLKYIIETSSVDKIPKTGKSTIGIIEVIGSGSASDTQ